jgi:hypothetical protein
VATQQVSFLLALLILNPKLQLARFVYLVIAEQVLSFHLHFFSVHVVADLGGHTWGISSVGPSLSSSITADFNGGHPNDLPLGFIPSTTLSPDYVAQSRQGAASSANCDISRLGPMGLFPSQNWSSLDLSAFCGDFDGHRQDEYVEFTPADDACPKVNISQLPPRYIPPPVRDLNQKHSACTSSLI